MFHKHLPVTLEHFSCDLEKLTLESYFSVRLKRLVLIVHLWLYQQLLFYLPPGFQSKNKSYHSEPLKVLKITHLSNPFKLMILQR